MPEPITMAIAAGIGGAQMIAGHIKKKQAEQMSPDIADPNRLGDLERARRKQRQFEAGTDTTTQQALQAGVQSTRATQRDLAGVTAGNVPGTVSALLRAQRLGGQIQNKAFADASARGFQQGALTESIAKEISQRKLDIEQFRSVQRRAEGAQLRKEGFANLAAAGTDLSGLLTPNVNTGNAASTSTTAGTGQATKRSSSVSPTTGPAMTGSNDMAGMTAATIRPFNAGGSNPPPSWLTSAFEK